ncbi:ornithine cyclodeaminase family protein [Sphingomonas colocasiae]|uniref:Ornithine cyclodeaminase family protein n=1 Tax=Sphingomonas colocasiae TaxID=1848973 RepID=A0ABS7PYR0_9SPHN|nr:ornithine cyclodeaminase family protein [Sphingomonas colocasiae]MBY8826246.1 ornithine cyclodeaminase family protein [Sphingomonas colocasiae]
MRQFSAEDVRAALDWPILIAAIRDGIAGDITVPLRQRHSIPVPGQADAALLMMPAWRAGHLIGVKLVTFFPDAERRINAAYILFDGRSGEAIALVDGEELTAKRTAASSVLAALHLARRDAARLMIIGTGRLSEEFASAYAANFPITDIAILGRSPARTAALVDELNGQGLPARIAREADVEDADIVVCVTSATSPVLSGRLLAPGAHVDLVGGFQPDMREADDEVFRRASVVFSDFAAARGEAGDLIGPFASGALTENRFGGELADLIQGRHPGRTDGDQITVFKSVGHASEDLAAASALLAADTVSG